MTSLGQAPEPTSLPRRGAWRRFWSPWNERVGYLFVLPSFVHLVIFLMIPLGFSLYLSFTDWNGPSFQNAPFIGLENYQFLAGDDRFWNAMKNSALFTLMAVPLGMMVSLLLAVIMNAKLRGVTVFRTLFFMPVVSSWVGVSVVWITLLDPNVGILNYLLALAHLPSINWLGDPRWALFSVVLVSTWKGAGFTMVIWLAGLQSIPKELYEAAALDGANGWQSFRWVTVPMLAPTSFFLLITGVIGSFQVFTPIYVMTKGGPLDSTDVVVFRIYQRAFQEFKMGYASAQAWVLFVVIFVLTMAQILYMRRRGSDGSFY